MAVAILKPSLTARTKDGDTRLSTATGAANSGVAEDYDESMIDMDLEGKLMHHIIEKLSH
jgi:hypothetical protein